MPALAGNRPAERLPALTRVARRGVRGECAADEPRPATPGGRGAALQMRAPEEQGRARLPCLLPRARRHGQAGPIRSSAAVVEGRAVGAGDRAAPAREASDGEQPDRPDASGGMGYAEAQWRPPASVAMMSPVKRIGQMGAARSARVRPHDPVAPERTMRWCARERSRIADPRGSRSARGGDGRVLRGAGSACSVVRDRVGSQAAFLAGSRERSDGPDGKPDIHHRECHFEFGK